jgi:hypothetical protein
VVVVPRGGTSLRLELRPSGDAQKTAASSARSSDAVDAVLVVGEVRRAVGRSAARKAVAGASSATSRCLRGIPRASIDGPSVTLWGVDDGVVTKVQVGGSLPDAAAGCLKGVLSVLELSVDGGGTVAVLVREGSGSCLFPRRSEVGDDTDPRSESTRQWVRPRHTVHCPHPVATAVNLETYRSAATHSLRRASGCLSIPSTSPGRR